MQRCMIATKMNCSIEPFYVANGGDAFSKRYQVRQLIDQGRNGRVYAAKRICDSLPVTIKIIGNFKGRMDPVNKQLPLEVSLLQKLSHIEGVIKLIEWFRNRNTLFIVMEYVESCIDIRRLNKKKGLTPELTRSLFLQLVKTVMECHAAGVIHRDIKPQNILVNQRTNTIKLVDFGSASYFQELYHSSTCRGTQVYMPLEMHRNRRYNGVAAEIWSLGVTLFYMASGRLLYGNAYQLSQMEEKGIVPPKNLPKHCWNLIGDMLKFDWTERISLEKVLQHPYLQTPHGFSNIKRRQLYDLFRRFKPDFRGCMCI